MELHDKLRRKRISLGLTQGRCAKEMELTRQTINSLETGRIKKRSSYVFYDLYLKDVERRREYSKMMRERYQRERSH